MTLAPAKRQILLIRLNRSNHCRPKRLKPKEQTPAGAASMCLNTQTLSQCNRVNPNARAANPRGDERETKL
jgi:hypothetical protein